MDSTAHARLEELLDREIELARALADHLQAERAALTGTSPDTLTKMAAEKLRMLAQFEALEVERGKLAAEAVNPPSIAQRWRSLMDLMAQCRTANETNGLIVNVRQGQIRQLIGILRGTPSGGTYGPHGQTLAHAARPLARA
jgi:flagellar biosynthesis/type III secretory pathway chaperone